MIHVIATIQVEPGKRAEVLAEFSRIVPAVHQEAGCLLYSPSIDLETNINGQADMRDNVVTVVESWESVEALEDHLIAPHMIAFRAAVKSLVQSVSLQIVQPA